MKRIIVTILLLLTATLVFSSCGNKATEGLEYSSLKDGTYEVSGYIGQSTTVYIPSEHNGVKVSKIGDNAFKNAQIQSIKGGKNVVEIGSHAFDGCYLLTKFELQGKIVIIDSYAFNECSMLKEIHLPDTVNKIENDAFRNCDSLSTISIPEGIERISYEVFFGCDNLKSVVLPQTITSIEFSAFQSCKSLEFIELPNSLNSIEHWAFKSCDSLSKISIPATVKTVGYEAFLSSNSAITVCVLGSDANWDRSWCNGANVIYEANQETGKQISVKTGTYKNKAYEQFGINDYIYVDAENCILKTSFLSYKYEIKGNILHSTPIDDSDAVILDFEYDDSNNVIRWKVGPEIREYTWVY